MRHIEHGKTPQEGARIGIDQQWRGRTRRDDESSIASGECQRCPFDFGGRVQGCQAVDPLIDEPTSARIEQAALFVQQYELIPTPLQHLLQLGRGLIK